MEVEIQVEQGGGAGGLSSLHPQTVSVTGTFPVVIGAGGAWSSNLVPGPGNNSNSTIGGPNPTVTAPMVVEVEVVVTVIMHARWIWWRWFWWWWMVLTVELLMEVCQSAVYWGRNSNSIKEIVVEEDIIIP